MAWVNQNTVLVGVAQARDIEFDAKYIGDWMLHCHLPHHMMNQMVSMVGPLSHGAHGHGIGTGAGMEEGMGMLRQRRRPQRRKSDLRWAAASAWPRMLIGRRRTSPLLDNRLPATPVTTAGTRRAQRRRTIRPA